MGNLRGHRHSRGVVIGSVVNIASSYWFEGAGVVALSEVISMSPKSRGLCSGTFSKAKTFLPVAFSSLRSLNLKSLASMARALRSALSEAFAKRTGRRLTVHQLPESRPSQGHHRQIVFEAMS